MVKKIIINRCGLGVNPRKYPRISASNILLGKLTLIVIFGFVSCSPPPYKNTFVIAGTYLEVISPSQEAAKIVYNEFKRLDKIFNLYDESSEVSRLNKTYHKPFKASSELIEVLGLAKDAYKLSGGAFDASQGALYMFWKQFIGKDKVEKLPSQEEIEKIKKMGGMENIEINPEDKTIIIKKQGLIIDLGGIAKGYLVDKAAMKLRQKGINSALINAGGDMYCLGINKDRPWRVAIKDPQELKGILETQELVDEAIATSGNYEQFFEYKGKRYSHLIDPRTGIPVDNELLSVSVITKNCTSADSLATAFFVMGPEGINKFLSQNPSTMRIILVTQDEKGKHVQMFY